MPDVVSQTAGVTVELEVERLGELIAKHTAAALARLFPRDTAEFWQVLCEQALRERQRVATLAHHTCPHGERCARIADSLADLHLANGQDHVPSAHV